jgi:hypothetical protein
VRAPRTAEKEMWFEGRGLKRCHPAAESTANRRATDSVPISKPSLRFLTQGPRRRRPRSAMGLFSSFHSRTASPGRKNWPR